MDLIAYKVPYVYENKNYVINLCGREAERKSFSTFGTFVPEFCPEKSDFTPIHLLAGFPENGPMSNTTVFIAQTQTWGDRTWWCADCRVPTDLDRHGRCGTCGSDAVDVMMRPNKLRKQTESPAVIFEVETPLVSVA